MLRRIEKGVPAFVSKLYDRNSSFPFPLQKGSPGSLFGTCFAALILHLFNKLQTSAARNDLVERLRALPEDEYGLILNTEYTSEDLLRPESHSPLYLQLQTTIFVRSALRALAAPPEAGVPWALRIAQKPGVKGWLEALPWDNPWLASNFDMFLGILLLEWLNLEADNCWVRSAVEDYFAWHDAVQSPETGFWGSQKDLHNAMAGAYHIVIHYSYAERPLRHVESMIDAVLALPWRDGLFVHGGGGGSCEDLDAIDLLVRLSLISTHRAAEVRKTVVSAARRIATGQNEDGGFGWRIVPKISGLTKAVADCDSTLALQISSSLAFGLRHRSHLSATHYYSSCRRYPFQINRSDLWSCWFRPMALSLAMKRYPEILSTECGWRLPDWPGLGFDPFCRSHEIRSANGIQ
jgi:hypothetical protein